MSTFDKKCPDISVFRTNENGPYRVSATVYDLTCLQAAELMEMLDDFYMKVKKARQ